MGKSKALVHTLDKPPKQLQGQRLEYEYCEGTKACVSIFEHFGYAFTIDVTCELESHAISLAHGAG